MLTKVELYTFMLWHPRNDGSYYKYLHLRVHYALSKMHSLHLILDEWSKL